MPMSVTDSYTQNQTRLLTPVTALVLNVATAIWRRTAANAHLGPGRETGVGNWGGKPGEKPGWETGTGVRNWGAKLG